MRARPFDGQGSEREKGRGIEFGRGGDSALREWLKNNGMDENREVAILAIGTTATRLGSLATGVVDAAMMTFPHNITAARAGLSRADIVHRFGYHPVTRRHCDSRWLAKIRSESGREVSPGDDPGLIYYSTNRSGAVSILARNARSSEDLAGKVYDLVKPALTPEGYSQRRFAAAGHESALGARRA